GGLDSIFGSGNTLVTPVTQGNNTASEYRISFIRDLGNANLPQLGVINGSAAIAPAGSLISQTVFDGLANTVQTLTVAPAVGADPNARITLTATLNGVTTTTAPLDYQPGIAPTAAQVQAALFAKPKEDGLPDQ